MIVKTEMDLESTLHGALSTGSVAHLANFLLMYESKSYSQSKDSV